MTETFNYFHPSEFDPPVRIGIVREVCRRMGLQLKCLQPREGYLLRIGNGERFFNHQVNVSTVNSHVATNIAKDKVYTYLILQAAGVRIPRGDYYFRPG